MLSVAIALEPPQPAAVVQQVTQSCEEAIGRGRCLAAEDVPPGSVVTWHARLLSTDPAVPELRIEFRDREGSGTLIETRVLTFAERDAARSRWASAGAVIAAFVAARDSAAPPPPPPPRPAPPPAPLRLPPAPLATDPLPSWNADLAAWTGPALGGGPYRFGALGRAALAVPSAPSALGLISLRYSERPGDVSLSWWGVGAGLGARVGSRGAAHAELTGEMVFERLAIAASQNDTGLRDDAAQNRWGGRLSLNGAWRLAGPLGVVAGIEADALRPAVTIRVGDEVAGRAPPVTFALSLGVRVFGGE
jgi:hypothetical protein